MRKLNLFSYSKMRRCLHGMLKVTKRRALPYQINKVSTLKCLQVWIEGGIQAEAVRELWSFRPELKMRGMLDVDPAAKTDSPLVLLNYFDVARNKKRDLFANANKMLAMDLMARVIWALRHEKVRIKHFRQVVRTRQAQSILWAWRNVVLGSKLMSKYIERSDQVREVRLKRLVLDELRLHANAKGDLDRRFYTLLKLRKMKMLG